MKENTVLLDKQDYDRLMEIKSSLDSLLKQESTKVVTVHIPAYNYSARPPEIIENVDVPKCIDRELTIMVNKLHQSQKVLYNTWKRVEELEKQVDTNLPIHLQMAKAALVGLMAGAFLYLALNII